MLQAICLAPAGNDIQDRARLTSSSGTPTARRVMNKFCGMPGGAGIPSNFIEVWFGKYGPSGIFCQFANLAVDKVVGIGAVADQLDLSKNGAAKAIFLMLLIDEPLQE